MWVILPTRARVWHHLTCSSKGWKLLCEDKYKLSRETTDELDWGLPRKKLTGVSYRIAHFTAVRQVQSHNFQHRHKLKLLFPAVVISALHYCIRFLAGLTNCGATFLIAIIKLLVILITPPSYTCLLASPSLFHPMSSPCLASEVFLYLSLVMQY